MARSAATRFLFTLIFSGAVVLGVTRADPVPSVKQHQTQSYPPPMLKSWARQIMQKVLSEAQSGKVVPYDITLEHSDHDRYNNPPPCDEGDEECWSRHPFYGMMGGAHGGYQYFCFDCKAARLRLRHKEYMLVAWYDADSWGICGPEDFSKCRPAIDQGLSIYECFPRKRPPHETEDLPCIYGDRYERFIDEDADGTLDTFEVMRDGTEYAYDFEEGTVCRELVDYKFDCWGEEDKKKIRPAEKRRMQKRYKKLLLMAAKVYGIYDKKQ